MSFCKIVGRSLGGDAWKTSQDFRGEVGASLSIRPIPEWDNTSFAEVSLEFTLHDA